jgi:hypothetical protein
MSSVPTSPGIPPRDLPRPRQRDRRARAGGSGGRGSGARGGQRGARPIVRSLGAAAAPRSGSPRRLAPRTRAPAADGIIDRGRGTGHRRGRAAHRIERGDGPAPQDRARAGDGLHRVDRRRNRLTSAPSLGCLGVKIPGNWKVGRWGRGRRGADNGRETPPLRARHILRPNGHRQCQWPSANGSACLARRALRPAYAATKSVTVRTPSGGSEAHLRSRYSRLHYGQRESWENGASDHHDPRQGAVRSQSRSS